MRIKIEISFAVVYTKQDWVLRTAICFQSARAPLRTRESYDPNTFLKVRVPIVFNSVHSCALQRYGN